MSARVRPATVSPVRVLSHSAWPALAREPFAAAVLFQHQANHGGSSRDLDNMDGVDMFGIDELRCMPVKIRTVAALLKRLYKQQNPQRRLRVCFVWCVCVCVCLSVLRPCDGESVPLGDGNGELLLAGWVQ